MDTIKTKYEQFVNKKKRRLTRRPLRKSGRLTRYRVPCCCLPLRRFFWNFAIKFSKLALTVSEKRYKLKQFLIYKRVFKEIPQLFWKDLKTQLL